MNLQADKKSILLVEDDAVLRGLVARQLQQIGYAVQTANTWKETQALLARFEPDLVILDMRLPDSNGLDLVEEIAGDHAVIVLTAYASIQNAVEAVKKGAVAYLSKPLNLEELELEVSRALKNLALQRDYDFVRDQQKAKRPSLMVGDSPALKELERMIDAVAQSTATVLLEGESGVGKELAARQIHDRSPRADRNYVVLDCCTLHENLFESELFGHEKGAFTGAISQKRGLIEAADGGTLFLDEIGEISQAAQAKLLRVIETGHFRRVGGVKDLTSDARIVAATNRDLAAMSKEGRFRQDLYYRLSAFSVRLPPLRERRADIPMLAAHFLEKHDFSRRFKKELSRSAERALVAYDWPGNVRELRNVMERSIILSGSEPAILVRHLGLPAAPGSGEVKLSFPHEASLDEVKQAYVRLLHARYSSHRGKLAAALGVSERNLYRLLQRYGLE